MNSGEPPVHPARTHADYIVNVLSMYQNADNYEVLWRVANGRVTFSADCSDTFHWASADCEEIGENDVDLLFLCYDALQQISRSALANLSELYAARKRGMRPMRKWLDHFAKDTPLRELFEACGPERDPATEG